MSVRCTDRTLPEAWLCFQLGWRDRESPVQTEKEEDRWVGGEEVRVVALAGGHPGADGWRLEDTQTRREGNRVEKTLQLTLFQGRGHRTVGETTENNPGREKMRESERSILFSMIL